MNQRNSILTGACLIIAMLIPAGASAQSSQPGMGSTPYPGGVTFRVWSPNATTVSVRGSFNGWGQTALVEEGTSDIWSTDVPGAAAGDQYKYFINNTFWWKDPRSRVVTQSGYDSSSANSIVYDPNAFNWMGDTRLPVTQSDLVIYEMHVGAFNDPTANGSPGTFTDAIARLDHLQDMGINAVELLPIVEFPGVYNWGYDPADQFAVENLAYGGPDGLKSFVKEAHARGIHVLLDVVHNHWSTQDLELYGFDTGPTNRFYQYTAPGICCTPWGERPNYSLDGVRDFITDTFIMWMDEYHVDGFRWDAVGAMREYDAGGGSYIDIPEADSLIQSINNTEIHLNRPGVISIAEDQSFGQGFDGEWDRGFGNFLINFAVEPNDANRNMFSLWNAVSAQSGFFRVTYTETHDLTGDLNGSGAQRLPKRVDSIDPDSYLARKRSMLAAAVVMTMPAMPMLFMGQEMLEDEQFSDSNPLDWTHKDTYPGVVNFYRDITHLRRNLDGVSLGLTGPSMTQQELDNTGKVLAYHRWGAGANDQVMVIMNWSGSTVTNYTLSFPVNGTWYVNLNSDWTTYGADFGNVGGSVIQVAGNSGTVGIAPYSVLILSRQAHPELDADNDGLLNGWEQLYFGDPLVAVPTNDDDLDGADNTNEQGADTDPKGTGSVLKLLSVSMANGDLTLQWQGGVNARQVVQKGATLGGSWTDIHTNNPPTSITNSLVIPSPEDEAYFRVSAGP